MRYILPLLWMRWKPSLHWACRKPLVALLWLEFGILVALFGLTGYAEPDTYRDNLRDDGALSGFNGSPGVNDYTESSTPLVYRQVSTIFAMYWTLTSLLLCILQGAMNILSILPPSWTAALSFALMAVWVIDVALMQAGASAPSGQQPWWISRSCSRVYYKSNHHYCVQAKALLGLSIVLIVVYATIIGLAIYSVRQNRKQPKEKGPAADEEDGGPEVVDERLDPFLVTPRQSRTQSMMVSTAPPSPRMPAQVTPKRQSFALEGRADTSLMGKMRKAKDEIIADIM